MQSMKDFFSTCMLRPQTSVGSIPAQKKNIQEKQFDNHAGK